MIFSALPGYRVIAWRLGEDGSENPPAILAFDEYAVLAWKTTNEGLVPVCENEIASYCGLPLDEEQYGVVTPIGRVLHSEYPSKSVDMFKQLVEADFRSGHLYFHRERDLANYAKRRPAAARHGASIGEPTVRESEIFRAVGETAFELAWSEDDVREFSTLLENNMIGRDTAKAA
jgi:hypothetical protein